ncbi:tRNA (adenosine(37)-N6)-threonylcarbamoyltransferase complex ATPase subunit type 1 TsaE [Paucibacter sp. APW11]|uniref:tRNA threonylcarbamoyladenosine biosynthesis protein TsaE n=1 Tax=Roseateles aquae TaxID=3077235 RepID=A0ABU3P524_9BURK|nr:tRNA (adenosine(37)-N6)-threonylcarbamoyltransferase complex ATPase subunit type 1 TsaE [Paucibacter sp. APW11]MDT8997675.1 tRNA (adenosine(37)-N6)-threonylcarbamoyltransferase complex ATPase subunit type 1 TsaE [Paucibacter sp. APW11]
MAILETRHFRWPDEAACERFAQDLALVLCQQARPGIGLDASVELHGSLGAGKTSLVRHLLRALGVSGRIKSPSYAVLESYALDGELGEVSHFDFYRFDDPREWEDAGFRDVFARPGLKLSEWPEKAVGMLPKPDLALHIAVQDDDSRRLRVETATARGQVLLQALAAALPAELQEHAA